MGMVGGRDVLWEKKDMFECFFRLEVDELDVGEEGEEQSVYVKKEDEDGDVDMDGLEEAGEIV